MPNVCKLYVRVYVSKDVMIRGYFSKPKGVREMKSLESTGLNRS